MLPYQFEALGGLIFCAVILSLSKDEGARREGVVNRMEVRIAPGETIESALRRFKKATQKAGILAEARKHEHYEKPSVRKKKKSAAARKRRA